MEIVGPLITPATPRSAQRIAGLPTSTITSLTPLPLHASCRLESPHQYSKISNLGHCLGFTVSAPCIRVGFFRISRSRHMLNDASQRSNIVGKSYHSVRAIQLCPRFFRGRTLKRLTTFNLEGVLNIGRRIPLQINQISSVEPYVTKVNPTASWCDIYPRHQRIPATDLPDA